MNQSALEQEFTKMFAMYGDAIFRFCVLKVSSVELAEDMTQEVFVRYWRYLIEGKEITHPRALLYTIAHNLAKDWYKKKKAESLDVHLEAGREPQATEASPEQVAEYTEVLEAIKDMDDVDKEVLLLRYVEGYGPSDIAEMIGESANVVSVRLNRATKRLQSQLGI
jgi:RNA polymerase sigma-70 factor (ECF subfamily)